MKKLILSILAVAGISTVAMADVTTVKTLYSGEARNVTWENTLSFGAEAFSDVKVGDYIFIEFSATTDVIELKSDGTWLPGSRYTILGEGVENYRSYITEGGLSYLQQYGLELCGANFTVTGVSVCNDGFIMPAGAVWGGFFWISDWDTLEIWKTAFNTYNGEKYMVVNISEDNGDNTGYVLNVLTGWDNPDLIIANSEKGNITKYSWGAIIDLTNVNLSSLLENTDRVMVQSNPEGGNPFNITAIYFTNNEDIATSVKSLKDDNTIVDVYSIQGVILRSGVEAKHALEALPAGLYIVGGKKIMKAF